HNGDIQFFFGKVTYAPPCTCVALILCFYDPYHGTVFLDGHDVHLLNLSWLRSQFGLVQQEPILLLI
ncbi:unnamed protein product, partial [Rotaria sp. Silwood2]